MLILWLIWPRGYPRLVSFISSTIPLFSGTTKFINALKMLPMAVNTLPLVSILTRSLTFAITHDILVLHFKLSMGRMPHICFAIMFWLSIRPSLLPENSYVVPTYLTITALGNSKVRALSSLCAWMAVRTRTILEPKVAHITHGSLSWRLSCSGVIWISTNRELLHRGVKKVVNNPSIFC